MSYQKIVMLVAVAIAAVPAPIFSRPPVDQPTPKVEVIEQAKTKGIASYYEGSRGFHGTPHVAVQDGKWTGKVQRHIEVCIRDHGCETLPVVDYCQCYRGEKKERIVDLSIETVRLFDLDTSAGIWHATIREVE